MRALLNGLLAVSLVGCGATQLDPQWEQRYAQMDAMVPICDEAGLLNPADSNVVEDYQRASQLWQDVYGDSLTQEYRFVYRQFVRSDRKHWPFICSQVDAEVYNWQRQLESAAQLASAVAASAPAATVPGETSSADTVGLPAPADVWSD